MAGAFDLGSCLCNKTLRAFDINVLVETVHDVAGEHVGGLLNRGGVDGVFVRGDEMDDTKLGCANSEG